MVGSYFTLKTFNNIEIIFSRKIKTCVFELVFIKRRKKESSYMLVTLQVVLQVQLTSLI